MIAVTHFIPAFEEVCDIQKELKCVSNKTRQLLNDWKVIANKQNAALTAVEQAADLTKVFKVINQEARRLTVTDIDPSRHPMKMKVTIAFQSDEMKHLNLGSKKTGTLIDFISVLPVIQQKQLQEKIFCLVCIKMEY